jgi:hypothetical protein
MEPNDIHQTIAAQIDNMKPAHLTPGVDIGMAPVNETTLAVVFPERHERFDITYDEGRDLYNVTRSTRPVPSVRIWLAHDPLEGVFCDQLGEILFGSEAEPWTLPFGYILTEDGVTRL